jgi:hypothetical protein
MYTKTTICGFQVKNGSTWKVEFEGLNGKSSVLGLQCTEIFENRSKGSKVRTFFVDKK